MECQLPQTDMLRWNASCHKPSTIAEPQIDDCLLITITIAVERTISTKMRMPTIVVKHEPCLQEEKM